MAYLLAELQFLRANSGWTDSGVLVKALHIQNEAATRGEHPLAFMGLSGTPSRGHGHTDSSAVALCRQLLGGR